MDIDRAIIIARRLLFLAHIRETAARGDLLRTVARYRRMA